MRTGLDQTNFLLIFRVVFRTSNNFMLPSSDIVPLALVLRKFRQVACNQSRTYQTARVQYLLAVDLLCLLHDLLALSFYYPNAPPLLQLGQAHTSVPNCSLSINATICKLLTVKCFWPACQESIADGCACHATARFRLSFTISTLWPIIFIVRNSIGNGIVNGGISSYNASTLAVVISTSDAWSLFRFYEIMHR